MKHKMIHYRGYFLLALVVTTAGAIVGTENIQAGLPLCLAGGFLCIIGGTKVALRNAQLKSTGHS